MPIATALMSGKRAMHYSVQVAFLFVCVMLHACGEKGDAPGSEALGAPSLTQSAADSAGENAGMPAGNGSPCKITSTNCDPDCQLSCGESANCVDLCCPESGSRGVLCDGTCRPNRCATFEASCRSVATDTKPWLCYEIDTTQHTMPATCFCGKVLGEQDASGFIGNWKAAAVTTCEKTYCELNANPDLDCTCSVEARSGSVASVPSCNQPPTECACDPCGN